MTEKRCADCGQVKPLDQFWKRSRSKDGLRTQCKMCATAATMAWRKANPERARVIDRRSYTKNRDKIRQQQRAAQPQNTIRQRDLRRRNRERVLDHYGHSCSCCGATDQLTIDHIDGGGAQHRRAIGAYAGGHCMNRWLIKNGFPGGFQVLCLSCNASKKTGSACQLEH